jgi:hypothetical protein
LKSGDARIAIHCRKLKLPLGGDNLENGETNAFLRKQTNHNHSQRLLVSDLQWQVTVEDLHYWNLLNVGNGVTFDVSDEAAITTRLADGEQIFGLKVKEQMSLLRRESCSPSRCIHINWGIP